jgi:hypothetical protein
VKTALKKTRAFAEKQQVRPKKMRLSQTLFSIFRGLAKCKSLSCNNVRDSAPLQKNHAKNTTVGFLNFGVSVKIRA